ncbi:MAG: aldo/keto reductase [Aeromicrobium sp.]|uniref:aldo/keto reductase n=1 Tax=Aeromicrobium sp. TaxID=1871063 RepID=UPI003C337B8A
MTSVPTISLNNGTSIPQLGYGVFQIKPDETKDATLSAFEVGYRHIDTAQMYQNEAGVGEALAASDLARDDVFITSKLNNGFHAHDDALAAFDLTLSTLGVDQIDLFLIHWPMPGIDIDFVETWKALEEVYRDGRAKAIGVSNFQANHLHRLIEETDVVPAVNQIEVHPYLVQDELREVCRELGIAVEAWSPIAQGQVLDNPAITGIAAEIGRTAAQVVLRWHIQRGDIVFPKSVTRSRVEENFALFDFELDNAQMGMITALDQGHRTGPNPDEFNYIPS